jgi:type II secretory pathway component PulJ
LNRSPKDTTSSQKRSASLPINEYNRALRSHSTATEDFPPHDASIEPARESIQADGYTRPRRATTPSRLWTPNKTPGYVDWTGLSPRPASSHARGSKVVDDAEADAPIGMAVTSGSHPNRRSRSLGEIRETVVAHPIARRRSDEIKYWRESYEPGVLSPMSSNKPEAEEPVLLNEPEVPQEEEPQEPPQPFNFGPLGEMAGMKITQAANLETRVQRLEERMSKMERMMSQRQYRTSGDHVQLQDPPKRESRNERSSSITRPSTDNSEPSLPKHRSREPHRQYLQDPALHSQQRSSSYGSSRPSTISTHNSYHPSFESFSPPTVPVPDAALSSGQNTARPLSTSTTIRGIPSSSPTMAKDAPLTGEHYVVLTNMILAEQAARQQLEAVVRTLQQQLQSLQSANSASYPTPGSDHPGDPVSEGTVVGGEFSSFEQDDSSDDEGRYLHDEVYQTPNEERGRFGDEIFGVVTSHNEGMKGEPRTLSLSQITLGKGMQHSLNF